MSGLKHISIATYENSNNELKETHSHPPPQSPWGVSLKNRDPLSLLSITLLEKLMWNGGSSSLRGRGPTAKWMVGISGFGLGCPGNTMQGDSECLHCTQLRDLDGLV